MPRKNIFQLVEENYDIYNEVNKIEYLFKNKHFVKSIKIDLSNNSYLDKINNNVLNSAKSSVK